MNLRPFIVFAAIAALLIGFIYWREHVTPPAAKVWHKAVEHRPAIAKKVAKRKEVVTKEVAVKETAAKEIKEIKEAVVQPPPVPRVRKMPKVAIVIDDFGYSMNNLETFFNIKEPLTLSILPNQRYSHEVANEAHSRGYEVLLHLPLEALSKDAPEESGTIRTGMVEKEVNSRLKRDLTGVPYIIGVSNHQGSKATEDKDLMGEILIYLKEKKLYFFDSLTSQNSVCREVAAETGVKYARRDIFLDNSSDIAAIEDQMAKLRKMALARGRAIAICHDRKNTAAVLSKVMPEMAKEGIEFVSLSDMVK